MDILVLSIIFLASVIICYSIAKQRGAKIAFWVAMAVLFGPLAIPFVFFSKPRTPSP